jgi:chloride channel protein, CIC family
MLRNRFFRRLCTKYLVEIDQFKIVYLLCLLDDVREIMVNSELYGTTTVRDLITIPPSHLDVRESIETVMETFRKTNAWNLFVLDKGIYVDFVSKSRVYATYRELLIQFSEE